MKDKKRMRFRTTRQQVQTCLDCGIVVDAATSIDHRSKPHEGAITICKCGHMMAYDAQLKFRPLTDEEVIDLAGDPKIVAIQNAIAKANTQKAIEKEMFTMFDAKFTRDKFHPKVESIINSPIEFIKYCATAESLPGYAGYGSTMDEAIRELMRSYMVEVLKNVTAKHNQRK